MNTRYTFALLCVFAPLFLGACVPVTAPAPGPLPQQEALAPSDVAPMTTAVTEALPATQAPEIGAAASETPPATRTRRPRVKAEVELVKLEIQALAGNLLGDPTERNVQIILPPGYAESDKRYPVVYMLHSYTGGDNYAWDIKSDYEAALRDNAIQEMILVFPNADNRLGGSMYLSSPTIGDYEDYLTKELVEYVDSHYRTLSQRESRGVAGCAMGGDGAVHLGFKYPDIFVAAVAMSGTYFWDRDPWLERSTSGFSQSPANDLEFAMLPSETQWEIAVAAALSPNPDNPPFYLDMPYTIVDGKAELAPGFVDKLRAADPVADAERYLQQPVRLDGLLVLHGHYAEAVPLELAQAFDALLTQKGIDHEFDGTLNSYCSNDMKLPMLEFFSEHLAFE